MLKDVNCVERTSTTMAFILLEDAAIKALFSEEEISYIQLKAGDSRNEISDALSSANNDVPIHLILSMYLIIKFK